MNEGGDEGEQDAPPDATPEADDVGGEQKEGEAEEKKEGEK